MLSCLLACLQFGLRSLLMNVRKASLESPSSVPGLVAAVKYTVVAVASVVVVRAAAVVVGIVVAE